MFYQTVIMPVLEYSYPTWHTGLLTQHDSEIIESIQKRAQYVIFPNINYQEALQTSKPQLLSSRRDHTSTSM